LKFYFIYFFDVFCFSNRELQHRLWQITNVSMKIVTYSRRQKYRNAERTLWEKVIFSALWKIGFSSEGDEFWFTVSHVG
jgi:hypothetical protein